MVDQRGGERYEQHQLQAMADELEKLQYQEDPEGIPLVKRIIECLRAEKLSAAKHVCFIDGDKLHSDPKIKQWLIDNLFNKDEANPWEWKPNL